MDELDCLFRQENETYAVAVHAFATGNQNQARQVCEREEEFDHEYWRFRHMHIERLQSGCCDPEAAVIYAETLRLLERVSDHADNLGIRVLRS